MTGRGPGLSFPFFFIVSFKAVALSLRQSPLNSTGAFPWSPVGPFIPPPIADHPELTLILGASTSHRAGKCSLQPHLAPEG